MPKVNIYKLNNDGSQEVVVTCRLAGEVVVCEGDEKLVRHLVDEGIYDYSQRSLKKLFPRDGRRFLGQLRNNFKSGYLLGSEVMEG